MEMFKVEDLKAGMLVGVLDEYDKLDLNLVIPTNDGLALSGEEHWCPVSDLTTDLDNYGNKVVKVYGLTNPMEAHQLAVKERPLLWDREVYEKRLKKDKQQDKLIQDLMNLMNDIACSGVDCDDMSCDECSLRKILEKYEIKERV